MTAPLERVVSSDTSEDRLWQVLECGHRIARPNNAQERKAKSRRCWECWMQDEEAVESADLERWAAGF